MKVFDVCFAYPLQQAPELGQWRKQRADFEQLWGILAPAIKNTPVELISLNCGLSSSQLLEMAISRMKGSTATYSELCKHIIMVPLKAFHVNFNHMTSVFVVMQVCLIILSWKSLSSMMMLMLMMTLPVKVLKVNSAK